MEVLPSPPFLSCKNVSLSEQQGMSNAAVVCMPTLMSHYNVVLHHFVSTVCCVMVGVSCLLSVCSRMY